MEFASEEDQKVCLHRIQGMQGGPIRAVREVSNEIFYRLTGVKRED